MKKAIVANQILHGRLPSTVRHPSMKAAAVKLFTSKESSIIVVSASKSTFSMRSESTMSPRRKDTFFR